MTRRNSKLGENILTALFLIVYLYEIIVVGSEALTGLSVESATILGGYWYKWPSLFTLFSSLFLHSSILHLFFNTYAMHSFMDTINISRFRTPAILKIIIFLLTGVAGNIASTLFFANNGITVGASGGIYGFAGYAAILLFLDSRTRAFSRRFLLTIVFYIVITIRPGINHWAHIGGFVAGIALGFAVGLVQKLIYKI